LSSFLFKKENRSYSKEKLVGCRSKCYLVPAMKNELHISRLSFSTQYLSREVTIHTTKGNPARRNEILVSFHAGKNEYISILTSRQEAAYALKRMRKMFTNSAASV
jgi:hypothetical protein